MRVAYVGDDNTTEVKQRKYDIRNMVYLGDVITASLKAQLSLEVKVVRGELYVRHGVLPPTAQITLRRYKQRSANRGARAKTSRLRDPQARYVHWRHIRLSHGTPGVWYKPTVIYASHNLAYVDKSVLEMCHELTLHAHRSVMEDRNSYSLDTGYFGAEVMPSLELALVLGSGPSVVRGWSTTASTKFKRLVARAKKSTHKAIYAKMALQVVLYDGTTHPDVYGELVRFKYRLQGIKTVGDTPRIARSITLN